MITFTGSGISWQGHLGGFLTGLAIIGVITYAPREKRDQYQIVGFVAIAILLVLAVVIRLYTFA
jgi:membrane associated rhomboid family serine protease